PVDEKADDGRPVVGRREEAQPKRRNARPQLVRERDRVTLDPIDADPLQIGERRLELIHLREGKRGIVEFPRGSIDFISMIVRLLFDVERSEAIDSDSIEKLPPDVER